MNVRSARAAILSAMWLWPCAATWADGCFVWQKGTDLEEPNQIAVILSDGTNEDLVLQVNYEGDAEHFAWIVPLPAAPEVTAGDPDMFSKLSRHTQMRGMIGYHGAGLAETTKEDVQVLTRKKVGDFDLTVLRAEKADALAQWLNKEGYSLPEKAKPVLDHYVSKKWTFSALRVSKDSPLWEQRSLKKGTLRPVHFRFASQEIVYPLKMTSLNRGKTDVLVYVFAPDALVHPLFDAQAPPTGILRTYRPVDVAKRFYAAVDKNAVATCTRLLPRLEAGTWYLSKLRNEFQTGDINDDVVFKSPEELSDAEKWAFARRQIGGSPGREVCSLLLRMHDVAVKVIEEVFRPLDPDGGILPTPRDPRLTFLVQYPSGPALDLLGKMARGTRVEMRRLVASEIEWNAADEHLPLLHVLANDADIEVRADAYGALGKIGNDDALNILLSRLQAGDARGRSTILRNLAKFSAERLVPVYESLFDSATLGDDEEYFCLLSLRRIRSGRALELVSRIYDRDDCSRNRREAIEILGVKADEVELQGKKISALDPGALSSAWYLWMYETLVSDLSPLRQATSLRQLHIIRSPVKDLSPIAALKDLRTLEIEGGAYHDIGPVASLRKLVSVDLRGSKVRSLDPVRSLGNLEQLRVTLDDVEDLSALAGLANLRQLFLYGIGGENADLSPVKGLTNLHTLAITGVGIGSLHAVADLRNLRSLEVRVGSKDPAPLDLAPLAGIVSLERLDLAGTRISDIRPLATLTNLQSLSLQRTAISDIRPLAGMTKLRTLDLRDTKVADIQVLSGLPELEVLLISRTPVSDISPLDNLPHLERLHFDDTPAQQKGQRATLRKR